MLLFLGQHLVTSAKIKMILVPLVEEILPLAAGFVITDLYPSLKFLRSVTGVKSKVQKIHKKMDKILEYIIAEHKMKDKFLLITKMLRLATKICFRFKIFPYIFHWNKMCFFCNLLCICLAAEKPSRKM